MQQRTGTLSRASYGRRNSRLPRSTLGGPRRSEAELDTLVADAACSVRLVKAKDRFGDYGIVGATLAQLPHDGSPHGVLDTFVLSCRAMGRGVEEAMLADVVEACSGSVSVTVVETAKNAPGRTFFATVGARPNLTTVIADQSWPATVKRGPRG